MTLKQFKFAKIITTIVVAIIVSQNVINREFFIPIVTVILASLILLYLKGRVKEVIADERDLNIAGKAAIITVQIYGWLAMIATFIFYSQQEKNPAFAPIAVTLGYSTCILLLIYASAFQIYNKIKR